MCNSTEIISTVKSGELTKCKQCNIYHLSFNNIYLEFSFKEFERFRTYILDIDTEYWEAKYATSNIKRKIPIPSMQENLVLLFKREEIGELKLLFKRLDSQEKQHMLKMEDIDYTLILN